MLHLAVNLDLKSRVTYSVIARRLHDDAMREFIQRQLDRIGLPHGTFTAGATGLIVRSNDGVLRKCRNLCLASMLEAVRSSAGTTGQEKGTGVVFDEIDTVDDFLNSYTYDDLHRLTRLDQTGQTGGNTVAEKRVDFSYNALGQFTSSLKRGRSL